jgi:transcriptional regulator with XRE-family HTH domain
MSFELYQEIGRRVRSLRQNKLDITQDQLAERLGISRPSLANIESGRQKMSVDQLLTFSNILGIGPLELIPQFDNSSSAESLVSTLPNHIDPKLRQWVETLQGKAS